MKKIFSYLLVVLVTTLSVTSLVKAKNVDSGTFDTVNGKITIVAQNGQTLNDGEEYKAFRILDLESYDSTKGAYSYKINEKWSEFIKSSDILNVYFKVNEQGYVTWIEGADVVSFAKLAYQYAINNSISSEVTKTVENGKVEFSDLKLGYYLINSSLGVVCSLDTTNNEVEIQEKNSLPAIDKVITTTDSKTSTASIGDSVPYTITLKNIAKLKNIKVIDTFSDGLTFNNDLVVKNGNNVLTLGDEYTLEIEGQKIIISISDAYSETLNNQDVISINYSATINENSITNVANENNAELTYGNASNIKTDPTKTYTYGFQFYKTDGKTLLTGAEFKLYDSLTNGNEIKVVFVKTENGINYYRVATDSEKGDAVVMSAGTVVVEGLKTGKYYLEETKQPEGYNLLASRVEVSVIAGNGSGEYEFSNTEVINTTGTILPSTGSIGTTLFLTVGSLIVLSLGTILITRFRMSKEY